MKIKKVLNNNTVIAFGNNDEEIVVMGLGLAFQKKSGQELEDEKIERIFTLENRENFERLKALINEIPTEYLDIAEEIIQNAEKRLEKKLDDSVLLALVDHINFAIIRYNQGMIIKNPMKWEVKRFYKIEYEIALEALEIIEKRLNIKFEECEAVNIALHIVNAGLDTDMPEIVEITNIIDEILNIIKYHFSISFDEESLSYYRLVTHLKFFAERVITNKLSKSEDDYLFTLLKEKYKEAYECILRIKKFLEKNYNFKISNEEITFLIVHVQKIIDNR